MSRRRVSRSMGPAPGVPIAAPGRPGNALTVPRTRSMIDCPISRPVRVGLLFTSIPPMTAKPRTRIRGDPGTRGTLRIFRSRLPINERPTRSTSKPSGTTMWIPPQKASAVMTTSAPSISAWRRSMSQPPITATAVVRPLSLQRPLACDRLMTATTQRRARLRVPSSAATARTGRSLMAPAMSSRVRARRATPTLSENSSRVRRPTTTCSRRRVTAWSRSASDTRSAPAPRLSSRRADRSGSIQSVMDAVCSPASRPACPRRDGSLTSA